MFAIPRLGTQNLRLGHLPDLRVWELYTGDREIGASVHWDRRRLVYWIVDPGTAYQSPAELESVVGPVEVADSEEYPRVKEGAGRADLP